MTLDSEQQRQLLLQLINNITISGNLMQVTQSVQALTELGRKVEKASLEKDDAPV